MSVVDVDLAHDRAGSGEPVLLLHGIAHRRQAWAPVFDRLAAERDVIAVDLPGHGESPDLPPDFRGDHHALADAVEAFAARLGLDRPHVVGNSLGGLMALELAARGSVRSATAVSPAGFWSTPGRIYARGVLAGASALLQRLPDGAVERVLSSTAGRTALVGLIVGRPSRHEPAELAADLWGLGRPKESFGVMLGALDSWNLPTKSQVPTTIGWGSRDLLLPRRQMRKLRTVLPEAHVYVLPGCGHVPMGDEPALVADLILGATRP